MSTQRSERLGRITRLAEAGERSTRRQLIAARRARDEAEAVLLDVYEQCRTVADGADVPVALGRALIESGWASMVASQERADWANDHAEQSEALWRRDRSRVDGLVRLLDRLDESEQQRREDLERADFDDLVSMRWNGVGSAPGALDDPVGRERAERKRVAEVVA